MLSTDLVRNVEVLQDLRKRGGQIDAGVRVRHFDEVKQHRHGRPLVLEVHGHSDERAVIRRCPSICGEVQITRIVLILGKLLPWSPAFAYELITYL